MTRLTADSALWANLVAYGTRDAEMLRGCALPGTFVTDWQSQ